MPPQIKKRASANAVDDVTLSIDEKILKAISDCYTRKNGILEIDSFLNQTESTFQQGQVPSNRKQHRSKFDSDLDHYDEDSQQQQRPNSHIAIQPPRKKITVMLVGNHSAGKSTFINWYVEDSKLLPTGVAIETRKFVLVTSGKKPDLLTGHGTLELFKHLDGIQRFEGVLDNIETRISDSRAKKFRLINFIDTPGLVDGAIRKALPQNRFDESDVMLHLADSQFVDLICVFIDPWIQATNKSLRVIERLNERHADKMRFYLSRSDVIKSERDRHKVLIQVTQNLAAHIKNRIFELPMIYVETNEINATTDDDSNNNNNNRNNGSGATTPRFHSAISEFNRLSKRDLKADANFVDAASSSSSSGTTTTNAIVPNSIGQLCREIELTIDQHVQRSLDNLDAHATYLLDRLQQRINVNSERECRNAQIRSTARTYASIALFFGLLPLALLVAIYSWCWWSGCKHTMTAYEPSSGVTPYVHQLPQNGSVLNSCIGTVYWLLQRNLGTNAVIGICFVLLLHFLVFSFLTKRTMQLYYHGTQSAATIHDIEEKRAVLEGIKKRKQELYRTYFEHRLDNEDLL